MMTLRAWLYIVLYLLTGYAVVHGVLVPWWKKNSERVDNSVAAFRALFVWTMMLWPIVLLDEVWYWMKILWCRLFHDHAKD